jgi:hypothetical protein
VAAGGKGSEAGNRMREVVYWWLFVRGAKECVKKRFFGDSDWYTGCYFWSFYIKIVVALCRYHCILN